MTWVPDYSVARPGGAALKAAGAQGVMRYTGDYRHDGAIITRAEWDDLTSHGLAVGLVMEYTADWILRGYAAGRQLAVAARVLEDSIGIPRGVTYAAIDYDITLGGPPQSAGALANCKAALATLQGMADGYGGWQYVGVYGSKWICDWIAANSPCTHFWSTQAWSWVNGNGFMPANTAALFQYASWPQGTTYVGGCDYNEARSDWAPRTTIQEDPVMAALTGAQASDYLVTIAKAVVQLGGAVTTLQQDVSAIGSILEYGDANRDGTIDHYGLLQVQADLRAINAAVKAIPAGATSGGEPVDIAPVMAELKTLSDKLAGLTLKAG